LFTGLASSHLPGLDCVTGRVVPNGEGTAYIAAELAKRPVAMLPPRKGLIALDHSRGEDSRVTAIPHS
jgi:hypothetical protein